MRIGFIRGLRGALLVLLSLCAASAFAQPLKVTGIEQYTENRGWNEAGIGPHYQMIVLAMVSPSGFPTLVYAEQDGVRQALMHFAQPSTPDLYVLFQRVEPQSSAPWRIVAERDGIKSAAAPNGNKIITTSGGGMLVSGDEALMREARFLASQAREPLPYYEHTRLGYNYRMSNVLAAIGRGQLLVLEDRVRARRRVFERYREALGDEPGISFMPEAPWGRSSRWLSVMLIDGEEFGADREDVRTALEAGDIEARPVWKPMHLQPVFRSARRVGGKVAEKLFQQGLCLPSGSRMTDGDIDRVVDAIRACRKPKRPAAVEPAPASKKKTTTRRAV